MGNPLSFEDMLGWVRVTGGVISWTRTLGCRKADIRPVCPGYEEVLLDLWVGGRLFEGNIRFEHAAAAKVLADTFLATVPCGPECSSHDPAVKVGG